MVELRSFIVRVRLKPAEKNYAVNVNGVVEVVETGARHSFISARELWEIVPGGKPPNRVRF